MKLNLFIATCIILVSSFAHAQETVTAKSSLDILNKQRYELQLNKNGIFYLDIPQGNLVLTENEHPVFRTIEFPRGSIHEVLYVLKKFSEYNLIIYDNNIAPFTSEIGTFPGNTILDNTVHWKCTIHNPKKNSVFLILSLENDSIINTDVILIKSSSLPILEDLMKQAYKLDRELFPK